MPAAFSRIAVLTVAIAVVACDGPHENAGEKIDARTGATGGASSIISGPAEKAGERRDREEAAADRRKPTPSGR